MKKQTLLVFATLSLILWTSSIMYVYANSTTFTISQGMYPNPVGYTIEKLGSIYQAKNPYGYIAFDGTNASQVINSAIQNLPTNLWGVPSGTIKLMSGNFSLSASLQTLHAVVTIIGESRFATVLKPTTDTFNVIEIGQTNKVSGVSIQNLHIWGTDSGNANGIYCFRGRFVSIKNVQIEYMGNYGIVFNATMVSEMQNTRIQHCGNGVLFTRDTETPTERSNGNAIIGGAINHINKTAVNITSSQGNHIGISAPTDIEFCSTGVWIGGDGASHWNNIGCWFEGNTLDINVSSGSKNYIQSCVLNTFADTGTRTLFRPVSQGFIQSGTGVFPNGETAYSWSHALFSTPNRLFVTWGEDIGDKRYWMTANSTHITLSLSASSGSAYTYYWFAEYKP